MSTRNHPTHGDLQARLKLTPLELEILNHRLDVSDSIIDVFADTDELCDYHEDNIYTVIQHLRAGNLYEAAGYDQRLTCDVLQECVEGSTYAACASQESEQKQAAIRRAGESLAEKLSLYCGKEFHFALY